MKSSGSIVSHTRWWDPLAAVLLIAAVLTAATRLTSTRWTSDLYLVQNLTFIGVLLGLALGYSRFSARLVTFFVVAYGLFMVPWQLGLTLSTHLEWKDRLLVLGERLRSTISLIISSKSVDDNIFFITLMACMFWLLSVHAGYSLVRHGEPWRAIIPPGVALFIIHIYDPYVPRRSWFLATYLFFALILVAQMAYIRGRTRWRHTNTHLPPDIGLDWLRFTLLIVLVLVIFSWSAPALAQTLPPAQQVWQFIRHPWLTLQTRLEHIFASLSPSAAIVHNQYVSNFALGRGSVLPETPVFAVSVPPATFSVGRYYWRAYGYDNYYAGQWTNSLNKVENLTPNNFTTAFPEYQGRVEQTLTFTPYVAITTLYAASQPIYVSVPIKATLGTAPDNTVDLVGLDSNPELDAGDSYQARSSITSMTEIQLQSAGKDYPQWVTEHYLQLPTNISTRTRELAASLTQATKNPYDAAVAITGYLRQYTYSDVIDAVPSNRELVDWWLFDYKKGFCQYYATAEVILLRTLGIPARLALGYAEGTYTQKLTPEQEKQQTQGVYIPPSAIGGEYLVRQLDAHAWPEVYFPSYGWVEFEPTASQTPLFRPSGAIAANNPGILEQDNLRERPMEDDETDLPPTTPPEPNFFVKYRTWIILAIAIVLVAGLSALGVITWRRHPEWGKTPVPVHLERGFIHLGLRPPNFLRRWARYVTLPHVEKAYLEINRALSLLGNPPAVNATPTERANALMRLVPATASPTRVLLVEYQLLTYSPRPGDERTAKQAGAEIRKLSYLAFLQRIISRLQEPRVKASTTASISR